MKVEKQKFDALLGKLLKAKPVPRKQIKVRGKRKADQGISRTKANPASTA